MKKRYPPTTTPILGGSVQEMNEENKLETKQAELAVKQDNLFWEWNEDGTLSVLWILETEDGKFYQKKKTINVGKR